MRDVVRNYSSLRPSITAGPVGEAWHGECGNDLGTVTVLSRVWRSSFQILAESWGCRWFVDTRRSADECSADSKALVSSSAAVASSAVAITVPDLPILKSGTKTAGWPLQILRRRIIVMLNKAFLCCVEAVIKLSRAGTTALVHS